MTFCDRSLKVGVFGWCFAVDALQLTFFIYLSFCGCFVVAVLRLVFCGWRFTVGVLRLAFCGWCFAVGVLRLAFCGLRFAVGGLRLTAIGVFAVVFFAVDVLASWLDDA